MTRLGRIFSRQMRPMAATLALGLLPTGGAAWWLWKDSAVAPPPSPTARPVRSTEVVRTSVEQFLSTQLLPGMVAVFDSEIDDARGKLAECEEALVLLGPQSSNDPATSAEGKAAAARRAESLAAEIARDRSLLASLQPASRPVPPATTEAVAAAQALTDAQTRLAELEARLTPRHPDVLRQIDVVRERQAAVQALAPRTPPMESSEPTEQMVLITRRIAANEEARARALSAGAAVAVRTTATDTTAERTRLTIERDALDTLITSLERQRSDVATRMSALAADQSAGIASLFASNASAPASPGPTTHNTIILVAGIGAACSGVLALAIGFVRDGRDRAIHNVTDLRAVTNAVLLGAVNEIAPRRTAAGAEERPLWSLATPASPTLIWHPLCPQRTLEQYRRIAQALRRQRGEPPIRVIAVTSALPSEGKTLSAVNLAVSIAESYRQRVLLVDADLRRPAVASHFALAAGEGLADWLGRRDERECPVVRLTSHLCVVTAGTPTNDPLPLLTSLRMAMFLAAARNDFDWVIVDTPPTGLIADASALDTSLDGYVVLALAGRAESTLLSHTVATLGTARVLGIILNRVRWSEGADRDEYTSYYAMPKGPS